MGQESAESALFRVLGVTREDNHPRHQQSSGSSLALEEDSALATFGAALQQLVSPTAGTRAETAESSDLPAELASVAASTPPVIGREISTLPFNNRQRCIKATGPYELRCEVLDNRQGKIIIEGPLSIYCAHLNSDHGVITATGPITILCGELDNQEGQISSHQGTIAITSRHALQNRQGKIAAQSGITIDNSQKSLNNSHGSISTPGQLQIHSGELDNPGGALLAKEGITILLDTGSIRGAGKIHSGDELQISLQSEQAAELQGVLQADREAQITAQGVLKNHSQISGKEITIEAPRIENAAEGSIGSQGHTLIVTGASNEGYFNNRGGVDGATTEICSYHLNNLGGGTIEGDQLRLGAHSLINNSEPESADRRAIISARQHLTMMAQHIVNQERALISSAGRMTVGEPVGGQQLIGEIVNLSNHSATIEAQGPAEFNIVTLNNEAGGTIHSERQLTINSHNLQGSGMISSAGELLVTLNGEQSKSLTGSMRASGELLLTAEGECHNHGKLQAGQRLMVRANLIHNHAEGVIQASNTQLLTNPGSQNQLINHGQIAGQLTELHTHNLHNFGKGTIDGDRLLLSTHTLINGGEQSHDSAGNRPEETDAEQAIISARKDLLLCSHRVYNRQQARIASQGTALFGGQLTGPHQVADSVVIFNNQGGKIDIQGAAELNIATLNNEAGSTIHAEQQLTLNSGDIQGPGIISSAGDLLVILNSDQTKRLTGPIQAQGNLTITANNDFNNHNRLQAGQQLTLQAAVIRNHVEGIITAATTRVLTHEGDQGLLRNRGLIDGQSTEVRAHSLNNLGSGVIYGNHLLLGAHTLTNDREQVGASTKALIIGRQSLKIGAQKLCNREGALIMSAGDMAVGARLDEQQQLMGQMTSLDNHSATIEVLGAAHFQLRKLHNLDIHFGVEYRNTSEPVVEYEGDFRSTSLEVGNLGWQSRRWPEAQLTRLPSGTHIPSHPSYHIWDALQAPDGSCLVSYIIFTYTRHIKQPVLAASCRPSKLHIGGNLYLDGELVNDKSQVVLGGKMIGPTQNIHLRDEVGTREFEETGSHISYWYERPGRRRQYGDRHPIHNRWEERVPLRAAVERRNSPLPSSGVVLAPLGTLALPGDAGGEQQALQPWSPSPSVQQVTMLARCSQRGAAWVVRSTLKPLRLPEVALFSVQLAGSGPVVITDPSFRCREDESSTALLLRELNWGSAAALPRPHGGSFYEQLCIREQVIQLTGQRFLPGFYSDLQQQQLLFARGMAAANRLQLIPGVPLTTAQQAQLTEAIVWPVAKPLSLANGTSIEVLDPLLYAPLLETAPLGDGNALLSARGFSLQLSGNLYNSGTLIASERLEIEAEHLDCREGTFIGNRTLITARKDIDSRGATFVGNQALQVHAGRDLHNRTEILTATVEEQSTGWSLHSSRSTLGKRAGFYALAPEAQMSVTADRHLTLTATRVGNFGEGGHTVISSGQDFTTDAVAVGGHDEIVWDAANYVKQGGMTDIGTQISTAGTAVLRAGRHFDSKALQVRTNLMPLDAATSGLTLEENTQLPALAATLASDQPLSLPGAGGGLKISVGGNLTSRPGRATRYHERATERTDSGFFSDTTLRTHQRHLQDIAISSTFSGERVVMVAGTDQTLGEGQLTIEGSNIVSDQETILVADHVKIMSAENYEQQFSFRQEEKSGLFSHGGLSFTLGEQKSSQQQQLEGTQQQSSIIGSQQGDVRIWAKQHYQQQGSHLLAPQGNIDVSAASLDILDTHNQQQLTQESSSCSSGLTLGVTNPALSAVQTAQQLQGAVSQTDDPRMRALAAAAGGLAAKNSYDAIKTNPQQLVGINASVSYGQSESHSESRQSHRTAQRSQVVARNITIKARTGDATLQGDLQAAEQARITATGQIKLLASENRSQQQSEQSSSSSSIGVGIGTHSGPAVTVSLSLAEGSSHGESGSYNLAQVSAGQKVVLQSGGDTLLQGEIRAPQIQGKVGGNLTIESLQDTDHQEGQQESLSVSLSGGCGHVSGSLNVNQSDYRSDFASVRQQAGIKAGDLGFQLQVAGNTHLEGAMIASSDQAIAAGCNQLETSTLSQRAIENRADYEAQSIGLGVGFSKDTSQAKQPALQQNGVGKDQPGQAATGALQVPGSQLPSQHGLSATIPIVMNASDSASSTTYSGISGAGQAVKITNKAAQQALTGQTPEQAIAGLAEHAKDGSNALAPIFNRQKIEAGFQIVGTLTREVGTFLENRAKEADSKQDLAKQLTAQAEDPSNNLSNVQRQSLANQANELEQQAQLISEKWGAGGTYRQITSALMAGVSGNMGASSGTWVQGAVVNYIQQNLAGEIGQLVAQDHLTEGSPLHATLHAIIAGAGAAASGQDITSAAGGSAAASLLTNLFELPTPETTEEERTAKRHLITTLVSGITVAAGGDVAAANTAALANVDNNWLASQQYEQFVREMELISDPYEQELKIEEYLQLGTTQDVATVIGFISGFGIAGWDTAKGSWHALKHPLETVKGLRLLISDPRVRAQAGEQLHSYLSGKLDNIERALREGGAGNAFMMGRDVGEVTAHTLSAVVAVYGAPKACASLTNLGLKVSTKAAKALATLDAATITAKSAQVAAKVGESARTLQQLGVGGVAREAGQIAVNVAKQVPGVALEVALQSTIGVSREQFARALTTLVNPECPLAARAEKFASMSTQAKGLLGEALAQKELDYLLPGSKVISCPLKPGEKGIDLVAKTQINGLDHYIIVEAKSGTSTLSRTKKDGLQMSDTWIRGEGSEFNRLLKSVGDVELELIKKAEENGRVEKWLIHTDKQQQISIKLLGTDGRPLPSAQQVSSILEKLQ